ncbi:uncharacterized protein A4U43_C02F20410 [Asparagus officinalis]|uniref:Uncharacterized protein n=1 Tax=Asparagus officinalis TaxID=4686 RepID=A0A5P1FPM1_ASPOF|nr:uncharacterized protein A4U43_C02F20410 [Asparagus officinalis]
MRAEVAPSLQLSLGLGFGFGEAFWMGRARVRVWGGGWALEEAATATVTAMAAAAEGWGSSERLVFSCGSLDLVCMYDPDDIYIRNPATGEQIALPRKSSVYDPAEERVEETIFSGESNFGVSFYVESFMTLDDESFKSLKKQEVV